jgi:hypothetical protein
VGTGTSFVLMGMQQLLAIRENCVYGELVDEMPVVKSTVSQHLKYRSTSRSCRKPDGYKNRTGTRCDRGTAGLLLHRPLNPESPTELKELIGKP